MKKFEKIAVQGHKNETAVEAAYSSRMGQERDQIVKVLVSFFSSFLIGGSQERLFAQSHSGKKVQRLNPKVQFKIEDQFENDTIPTISFDVGLLIEQDADLAPGIEHNSKLRRITQRVSGKLPITINIIARSDEELSILQWSVRQVFLKYIHRLYRGLIINEQNSWQIGFPKSLELSTKTSEMAEGGSGGDILYKVTEVVFSVLYDSVFVEVAEKPIISVIPGFVPRLSVLPLVVDTNDLKIGLAAEFAISKTAPLLSAYLEDSTLGRISVNSMETKLVVFGSKVGATNLVVKTNTDEVTLPITITF